MAKKHVYDDDDGRTIADMSGVERQRLFVPKIPKRENAARETEPAPFGDVQHDPMKNPRLSKSEGRAYVFGALGAALLIGAVFAIAFFLFIVIFLAIYR